MEVGMLVHAMDGWFSIWKSAKEISQNFTFPLSMHEFSCGYKVHFPSDSVLFSIFSCGYLPLACLWEVLKSFTHVFIGLLVLWLNCESSPYISAVSLLSEICIGTNILFYDWRFFILLLEHSCYLCILGSL